MNVVIFILQLFLMWVVACLLSWGMGALFHGIGVLDVALTWPGIAFVSFVALLCYVVGGFIRPVVRP